MKLFITAESHKHTQDPFVLPDGTWYKGHRWTPPNDYYVVLRINGSNTRHWLIEGATKHQADYIVRKFKEAR